MLQKPLDLSRRPAPLLIVYCAVAAVEVAAEEVEVSAEVESGGGVDRNVSALDQISDRIVDMVLR